MNEKVEVLEEMKGLTPYIDSLLNPRKAIRYISKLYVIPFYWVMVYLFGVISSLDNMTRNEFSITSLHVGMIVVLSGLFGVIQLYFTAWVISWFGKLFGGLAEAAELRAAVLWNKVPLMAILPLIIFTTIGQSENLRYLVHVNLAVTILYWLAIAVEITLVIWCFINLVRMVSEVQGFSNSKAFFSIILPAIILVAVIVVLFIVI